MERLWPVKPVQPEQMELFSAGDSTGFSRSPDPFATTFLCHGSFAFAFFSLGRQILIADDSQLSFKKSIYAYTVLYCLILYCTVVSVITHGLIDFCIHGDIYIYIF